MAKNPKSTTPQIILELPKPKRPVHPNTLKNLKPFFKPGNPWAWKPGQSGNPRGAGARQPITELYRRTIEESCENAEILAALGLPEGSTWGAVLVKAAYFRASSGDVAALHEITNRVDGPIQRPIEEVPLPDDADNSGRIRAIVARVRGRLAAASEGQGQEITGELIEREPSSE